jgi:hypothetical protein
VSFIKEFIGYFKADNDIALDRIKLCKGCKFLTPSFRCTKCGCFMKVKTQVTHAKCPMGKW